MPIDPRIPLMVQPPASPIEGYLAGQQAAQRQLLIQSELQQRQQEAQIAQVKLGMIQRAQQGEDRANAIIAKLPRNEDGTINTDNLQQQFSANQVPLDISERFMTSVDNFNKINSGFAQHRKDAIASAADFMLKNHKPEDGPWTPEGVQLAAAELRQGGVLDEAGQKRLTQMIAQGTDPEHVLQLARSQGSQFNKTEKFGTVSPGGSVYSETTGKITTTAPAAPETPYQIQEAAAKERELAIKEREEGTNRRLVEARIKEALASAGKSGVEASKAAAEAKMLAGFGGGGVTTAPPKAAKIGERRVINGQLGEWDGKGWKPVQP